ncbi:hypothetical protein TTHERM_00693220 (macronuclear) [Tetrahymena thermophila SB210]|uniref:Uncharacterized protein n=1 Tax=Tetrahymena thermophila (strain SB210) TaxID=312017 RepID=Q244Z5_TETTS|nr:hypothetical protein TTHERM_00693220 [Tetrahymena thermophila SB210]EAS03342.1 hypothetical protein TTHERM_00693220 [Tetrahymena thermophila SB210]|eukprot:XP_001023587.1 hypothetical protein TTHERM_00693220 [Tetrahymena thermophila SB210]
MILNDPVLDVSFYDKQSFCCRESREIPIPKELTLDMNVKRDLKFPNLSQNQENQIMTNPSKQFISLSKIDTANTPDYEFQQTANFFFPQFEQQTQKEQAKESDFEYIQKARGNSVFAFPIDNENNQQFQLQQQSLSGAESDSMKKKIRFSRILVNSHVVQNEERQAPVKTLKRSVISMSQPKLHGQGGGSSINQNFEKEISTQDQMGLTHNLERNLSQKKIALETRETAKVLSRQNIQTEQLQKEQNSQVILSSTVQKHMNQNNNNSILNNQYLTKDQQDLRLNNFIQLMNEKQPINPNSHNFQLNNIFPQSTSSIQKCSRELFGKQSQKQQQPQQLNLAKYQKQTLKLPDENNVVDSNQVFREINAQSCQSKLGSGLNEKSKNINNISLQNQIQFKSNMNLNKNMNQISYGAQNFYNQQNKCDLLNQQQQSTLNSNQISKQVSRKGSSSCLEDIQKNLVDDNFMQQLKQQQMSLLKIRYQQIKNFQDLNSNASPIENNIQNLNNNGNLLMRQDIKGQLLYSSQQDSRRNYSSLTKSPFCNVQNSISNDLRNLQVLSSDNKKMGGNILNQEENQNRFNLNLINTIKQRTINNKQQIDNFYSKVPTTQKNQNIHNNNQIANDFDDSEENIKLDADAVRLSNKNLFHRRSVAGVFNSHSTKNNAIQKEQNDEQAISEIEKVRRQIKQAITKGVRSDLKNSLQTLPQLSSNNIQIQQQQKKIDSHNINFAMPKKIYQSINCEALQKIQNNLEDVTASGRDIAAESNFSLVGKVGQCKTFLQRKPQENIVNKIFQIPNEIILE